MIHAIQKARSFKFLSSVRLAVPLMLVLAVTVAVGTLYEARYNAQFAGMMVYRSWWFHALLGLLWVNIFAAALSRWPFKLHHTGFVITHIGLLTLLAGAEITFLQGIDGQMRVTEGASSSTVALPELVIKTARTGSSNVLTHSFDRTLHPQESVRLADFENSTGLRIEKYLPFVSVKQGFKADGNGRVVRFRLQSQFFNVEESLHSSQKPELQMGPALIRLGGETPAARTAAPHGKLVIKRAGSGEILAAIDLRNKSAVPSAPRSVGGSSVRISRIFESAQVAGGKLVDTGQAGANPALELQITTGGVTVREVAFAKFPGFLINPKAGHGLAFEYTPVHEGRSHTQSASTPQGNVITFVTSAKDGGVNGLKLEKNGQTVLSKPIQKGETIETPWMGMKVTLLDSLDAAEGAEDSVTPIELQAKSDLPPAAIRVAGTWIPEGEVRTIQNPQTGESHDIYFGMRTVDLPFSLALQEFRKKDYPGTDTAMSFQSTVLVNGRGDPVTIKMNEPLEHAGFIIYQSSYEMGQGRATASIFSVNQDPGRFIKYLGAIILAIGIILFTLMRSRVYRNWMKRTAERHQGD